MLSSILLFEPNDEARRVFADALRAAGCTVTLAADSDGAFSAATTQGADVIVIACDSAIRAERLALCNRLAADARTKNIPILLTSAAFDQQELQVATDTGVLALVVESVDSAKLVSAVRGVIAARGKPPAARASVRPTEKSARSG